MSIYYTNTNNREIFAHSITATVINGVTGSPIPGPPGPTGPTGPNPITNTNPWFYAPTVLGYTGINNVPWTLGGPIISGSIAGTTGFSDGMTGINFPTYSVPLGITGITGAYSAFGQIELYIIDGLDQDLFIDLFVTDNAIIGVSGATAGSSLNQRSVVLGSLPNVITISQYAAGPVYPFISGNNVNYGITIESHDFTGSTGPYNYIARYLLQSPGIAQESISFV